MSMSMCDLIDPLARAICYTPPHFADSLGTAAKCLQTKLGAHQGDILRLWPRVEFLLPVHQCVHGAGTGVTACDSGVTATKRPRCLVLVATLSALHRPGRRRAPLDGPQDENGWAS